MASPSSLQPYEEFYYGYQVEGRGLVEAHDLRNKFGQRLGWYDSLMSGAIATVERGKALDIGRGYGRGRAAQGCL